MLMLAGREHPGTATPTHEARTSSGTSATATTVGLADGALRLSEAIGRHRDEGRRLATAAMTHRTELRALLRQRNAHMAKLYAAGWSLTRIAALYQVTGERVGQIIRALRPDADDGAVA